MVSQVWHEFRGNWVENWGYTKKTSCLPKKADSQPLLCNPWGIRWCKKSVHDDTVPHSEQRNVFCKIWITNSQSGKDPAIYRWEQELLVKVNPNICSEASAALFTRQFIRGLLKELKMKLLGNDPTPHLNKVISSILRHQAMRELAYLFGHTAAVRDTGPLPNRMTITVSIKKAQKQKLYSWLP